MEKKLIVVDKNDKVLTYKTWEECHQLNGALHRAFSIFVFNKKCQLLLQKRSKQKPLWPLYWSNTCCSHPRQGENLIESAGKRLKEELGFTTKLKILYNFCYQATYKTKGRENELCYVLFGKYEGLVKPNRKEVADYKWVNLVWLNQNIKQSQQKYTPWFKKELRKIKQLCGNFADNMRKKKLGIRDQITRG